MYADDPLEAARSFVEAGARYLHVVDLDGAREGEPANLDHLERITRDARRAGAVRRRAALADVDPQGAVGRRRARGGGHGRLRGRRVPGGGDRHLGPARARGRRRPGRAGVGLRVDPRDADAPGGADRPPPAPGRAPLRLHQRRQGRDARGRRRGRGAAHLRGGARPVHLVGRHRLARRPSHAARPAAAEPGGRDLRQGAVRGPLRGGRGPAPSWRRPAAA